MLVQGRAGPLDLIHPCSQGLHGINNQHSDGRVNYQVRNQQDRRRIKDHVRMNHFTRKHHGDAAHKALRVPADDQSHPDAQGISNQKKCVGREPGEGLFRFLVVPHYRILNGLRTIGVMREVLTESGGKMPDAYYEECENDGPAGEIKSLPQMGFDHGHKKRGEK